MPVRPQRVTFTNSSADVLNAIRNSSSIDYRNYVPIATPDAESIREIGKIIMDEPELQNEFVRALINRIGKVLISSKMYENPWAMFKAGRLDFGEVIEDVFIELLKVYQYDPAYAETNVEKREMPDVRSTFYVLNFEKYYKVTIQQRDLKRAFLSADGVTNFITGIIEQLYTSASYDEFQVMKYMLAKRALSGQITLVGIPAGSSTTALATAFKGASNSMEFKNTKYNIAHVHNEVKKNGQYLILSAEMDAKMDVEVLASAFNMNKAEFLGHRVMVDGFDEFDWERLDMLFAGQANYSRFTADQLETLGSILGIIVDADFFKVYNVDEETRSRENEEGLYRNYWYHVAKIFATSPFANCALFADDTTATITSVSVSPASVTLAVGGQAMVTATVNGGDFANKAVIYTSSDTDIATVNNAGVITGVAEGTATITATSSADSTKTATVSVTVSE